MKVTTSTPNTAPADLAAAGEHPALTRLKAAATRAGFTCIDTVWKGYHVAHAFQCPAGHGFVRNAVYFLKRAAPSPCPQCERESLRQRFLTTVADKSGTCLEGDYLGRMVRHRLRCRKGHEWQPEGRKILEGSWCPDCGRAAMVEKLRARAGSLEALQAKAAERGGRCLSTTYVDLSHRYAFECAEGHRWTSTGVNVMGGHWCRRCCNVKHSQHMRHPEGMARIHATARVKGGVCLDNTYHGVEATYRFRCKAGRVVDVRTECPVRPVVHGVLSRQSATGYRENARNRA